MSRAQILSLFLAIIQDEKTTNILTSRLQHACVYDSCARIYAPIFMKTRWFLTEFFYQFPKQWSGSYSIMIDLQ